MGKISLVKTDGSGYKELETGDGLTAVALGDMPIWMTVGGNVNDCWREHATSNILKFKWYISKWHACQLPSDMTRLWYREDQQQKLWFEVGTKVLGLKAYSNSTQSGKWQLNSQGDLVLL